MNCYRRFVKIPTHFWSSLPETVSGSFSLWVRKCSRSFGNKFKKQSRSRGHFPAYKNRPQERPFNFLVLSVHKCFSRQADLRIYDRDRFPYLLRIERCLQRYADSIREISNADDDEGEPLSLGELNDHFAGSVSRVLTLFRSLASWTWTGRFC